MLVKSVASRFFIVAIVAIVAIVTIDILAMAEPRHGGPGCGGATAWGTGLCGVSAWEI